MSKQKTSFSISEVAEQQLGKLADENGLSKSATLEILIRQASAANWSVVHPATAWAEPVSASPIGLDSPITSNEASYALKMHVWYSAFPAWYKRGLPRNYTLRDILSMHASIHPSKDWAREGALERLQEYHAADSKRRKELHQLMWEQQRR